MVRFGSGKIDGAARYALVAFPLTVGLTSLGLGYVLSSPGAFLPAVSLFAGVLLAAGGQLISLRARISDSVVLAGNVRVRRIFREAVSGVFVAALTAVFAAVVLGVLQAVPAKFARTAEVLTACSIALMVFLVLMLLATIRRMYMAYLEAFEGGVPLSKHANADEDAVAGQLTSDGEDDDQGNEVLRGAGIPERVRKG